MVLEKKIKVLNLYAGIGGNRKLWDNDKVEVTAVENVPEIAKIYRDFFPNDKVIVTDAHKYLLEHYNEFDFIWSSPPCPTHSRMRNLKNNCEEAEKKFPDMKLYEEILFLKHFFKGKWVVENVISYYDPLIKPFPSENHYFWSNFTILKRPNRKRDIRRTKFNKHLFNQWGFNLIDYVIPNRIKTNLLNNLVHPKLGESVFNCAFKETQAVLNGD